MAYIFDTNIFIRSKNEMPMELWPTFWSKMTEMVEAGIVLSSDKVKEEIIRGHDELTEWVENKLPATFFLPLNAAVMSKYQDTQIWAAQTGQFTESALQTFANVADAYIVATAAANDMTLVTYEKSNTGSKKRVLIPDVCNALGVRCCDFNTVLREMGITI